MRFFEEFLRCLAWRPFQAMEALYWWITGRKVRARGRLRRNAHQAPYAYTIWQQTIETARVATVAEMRRQGWTEAPRISIVLLMASGSVSRDVASSLDSVLQQSYDRFEVILPAASSTVMALHDPRFRTGPQEASQSELASALQAADGDYVLFLRAGNRLSPDALMMFVNALQQPPQPAILFGDQDLLCGRRKRHTPWFKPQWNSEMFLAQDYLSDACLIDLKLARIALVRIDASVATPYALLLAATAVTQRAIVNVPHIVCHVRDEAAAHRSSDATLRLKAVADHVMGQGGDVQPGPFSTVHVRWPLPEPAPLVSIVIPTRDKVGLLETCLTGLLQLTEYPNYEILIVDNQSEEMETKLYLEAIQSQASNIKILKYNDEYNYSAINNFAVKQAEGQFICLLNNDTEIVDGAWLSAMMRYAAKPEAGAVGAMLLYPDGTIQHAGVLLGMGDAAGHAHRFLPRSEPGYFAQAHIARYISAVTAACLLIEKRKFDAVGGLDEKAFAIAYNDVDLCLKLERAGWKNVYVPQAVLIHHESKSRGSDMSPIHIERYMGELSRLQACWNTRSIIDPSHHLDLDRTTETYRLKL